MLKTDRYTYHTVGLLLLNCSAYPIDNLQLKTGYDATMFDRLEQKYNGRDTYLFEDADIPIIASGVETIIEEMTTGFSPNNVDGDLVPLMEITKLEGRKLSDLLQRVSRNLSHDAEINIKDWKLNG